MRGRARQGHEAALALASDGEWTLVPARFRSRARSLASCRNRAQRALLGREALGERPIASTFGIPENRNVIVASSAAPSTASPAAGTDAALENSPITRRQRELL